MATQIDICNFALAHLAISSRIAALTERSKEAGVCSLFYDQVLVEVLRDFPWTFSRKVACLTLVEDFRSTVPREWDFAYRLPTDLCKVRRILNGISRVETRATRVSFILGQDAEGGLLFTDQPDAQLEYTYTNMDPSTYPPDFAQVLALLLAVYIAPAITGGDQFKLGQRAQQLYEWKRMDARVNTLDEMQADMLPDSEQILARDGARIFRGQPGYGDCR